MVKVIIDWYPEYSVDSMSKTVRYSVNDRVKLCHADDLKGLEGRARLATGVSYFVICNELHEWFMKVDPRYRHRVKLERLWVEEASQSHGRKYDRCAFVLNFRESSLAMMFKLMFGGEPKLK